MQGGAMEVTRLISVLLLFLIHPSHSLNSGAQVLGAGAYLPIVDTLADLPNTRNIFSIDISKYVRTTPYPVKKQTTQFSSQSTEVYNELAQNSGITGSYKSVTFSMQETYKTISKGTTDISSFYILRYSLNEKMELGKDDLAKVPLSTDFVNDLAQLPITINDPGKQSSWTPIAEFLKRWGSHYVSSVYTGSWIQQWTVAKSLQNYSQKDFNARACSDVNGGTKSLNLSACAGVSQAEMDRSSTFQMSDTLFVKGGTPETRSKLIDGRTSKLLELFMLEGATSSTPVKYLYSSLSSLIRDRYSFGSKEWQIARNLEAYYHGYLAFGCGYELASSLVIQNFVAVTDSYVHYECVRSCRGCHSDKDCHIGGAFASVCYCYGNTCIETDQDNHPLVRLDKKGSYSEGENTSCRYQIGVWCACKRKEVFNEQGCREDGTLVLWSQSSLQSTHTTLNVNITSNNKALANKINITVLAP